MLNRLARLLGITELQAVTGHLATSIDEIRSRSSDALVAQSVLRKEMGELERLIARRLDDLTSASRNEILQTARQYSDERLNAAQEAVVAHATGHTAEVTDALRSEILKALTGLQRDIDLLRALSKQTGPSVPGESAAPSETHSPSQIDEVMYVALEDHFRGSQEIVRSRQGAYLPHVRNVVDAEHQLIDFGCGRGEWLEILRAEGLPATGYDSNRVCVSECLGKGLKAEVGDLVKVLRGLEDGTVGAVTFFQVFEHLPFDVLESVIRECRRVLRSGGVLIAEVPNSENLSVGSSTFWIDPTHHRPLHPEVLRFMARKLGFAEVSGIYSTPLRSAPVFEETGMLADVVGEIHRTLYGPADFALIAKA